MNLQGYKIGYLEVINKNLEDERTGTYWLCKCNCPECTSRRNKKLISIRQDKLLEGRTTSCGYSKELQKTRGNFKTNRFVLKEDYCIGYTYKGEEYYFDKEDYDLVISVSKSWAFNDSGYVAARDMRDSANKYNDGRRKYVYLKDVVMNKIPGEKVEYINSKNRFDNRKSNLRKKVQNMRNDIKLENYAPEEQIRSMNKEELVGLYKRVITDIENNNDLNSGMVNYFLGLILHGEDVNVAIEKSGIGNMSVKDVIGEIAGAWKANTLEAILNEVGAIKEDDLEKEFSEKAVEFVDWLKTTDVAAKYEGNLREGIEMIQKLDVAMTELHKVSDETSEILDKTEE